jgi:hypothetical protein
MEDEFERRTKLVCKIINDLMEEDKRKSKERTKRYDSFGLN